MVVDGGREVAVVLGVVGLRFEVLGCALLLVGGLGEFFHVLGQEIVKALELPFLLFQVEPLLFFQLDRDFEIMFDFAFHLGKGGQISLQLSTFSPQNVVFTRYLGDLAPKTLNLLPSLLKPILQPQILRLQHLIPILQPRDLPARLDKTLPPDPLLNNINLAILQNLLPQLLILRPHLLLQIRYLPLINLDLLLQPLDPSLLHLEPVRPPFIRVLVILHCILELLDGVA